MNNKKIYFEEIINALATLDQVTGCEFQIVLKSNEWATLEKQKGEQIKIFNWQDPEKGSPLGNRILEYIVNMIKDHLVKELIKLEVTQKNTSKKLADVENILKIIKESESST